MQRAASIALIVTLALARAGWGDTPTPPTTTTDPTVYQPPTESTTVKGTLPDDFEGRWLLVCKVGIGSGPGRAVGSLWEVTRKDGQLNLDERLVVFPPAQVQAMEEANQKSGGDWTPTPADIDVVRAGWDTLPPEGRGVKTIAHELFGPDGYDDAIKAEPKTKDALWIGRQVYEFGPGGGRPIKQVNVLSALTKTDGGYTGNYTSVVVAAAPFPIPIKFDGTFKLIRLGNPPARGFLARLLDVFSGCNAKK
jgi:hypothetical protein